MSQVIGLEMGRINYGLNNPDAMRLDIDPMYRRGKGRFKELSKKIIPIVITLLALAACGTGSTVAAPAVDASPTSPPSCATARLGSSVMSLAGELGGGYNSIVTVDRENDGVVDFEGSPHEGGMIYFNTDGSPNSVVCLIK